MELEQLSTAVIAAFRAAPLPLRNFDRETDMEAVLLPAMKLLLKPQGIELVHERVRKVACFLPGETREPDGEARRGEFSIALELKLLRGVRQDGGEFHRGFGQCFTYVASSIYVAALMLVVHQGPRRALTLPPAALGLNLEPFRRVTIADRWHDISPVG